MNTFFKKSSLAALALTMAVPVATSTPTPVKANDAFVGGLVGGFIGGAVGSRRRSPDVVYVQPRTVYRERRVYVEHGEDPRHDAWCGAKYRSYDPYTNTYVSFSGKILYCNSPYG